VEGSTVVYGVGECARYLHFLLIPKRGRQRLERWVGIAFVLLLDELAALVEHAYQDRTMKVCTGGQPTSLNSSENTRIVRGRVVTMVMRPVIAPGTTFRKFHDR
jgi:hypothetical protein